MIAGIGVDLVDLSRFEHSLERTPGLRTRLFTPEDHALPARSLAGRFAAKEALIKAFGGSTGLHWQEIQIVADALGAPSFLLTGESRERQNQLGVDTLHLTISHDAGAAIAFVIAERTVSP